MNPIRYRGYYYDTETGLYYCLSRYYDPNVGRFINGDGLVNIESTNMSALNMFAYCYNIPVDLQDSCGHVPGNLFTSADKAVIDFADNYNTLSIKNNWEYATFVYRVYVYTDRYHRVTRYSYYEPWTDEKNASVSVDFSRNTKGYKLVAIVHAHGAKIGNYDHENFSGDPGDIGVAKAFKLNIYVTTPGGKIKL